MCREPINASWYAHFASNSNESAAKHMQNATRESRLFAKLFLRSSANSMDFLGGRRVTIKLAYSNDLCSLHTSHVRFFDKVSTRESPFSRSMHEEVAFESWIHAKWNQSHCEIVVATRRVFFSPKINANSTVRCSLYRSIPIPFPHPIKRRRQFFFFDFFRLHSSTTTQRLIPGNEPSRIETEKK